MIEKYLDKKMQSSINTYFININLARPKIFIKKPINASIK